MSGHSKWHNIQHKKGAADAARSGLFTKLAREITMAAKLGDKNPDNNPRLRLAILTAGIAVTLPYWRKRWRLPRSLAVKAPFFLFRSFKTQKF